MCIMGILRIILKMTKQYKTLYKVASTGKVYQWSIRIDQDDDGKIYMITANGYRDGKCNENRREIKAGKAGRTKMEQVILEADRKFKDKVEKKGYSPNLQAVSENKIQVIRPMLAQKLNVTKLGKSVKLPALAQIKYDGIRTLGYKDSDGNIEMESRQGKHWPHMDIIKDSLREVYDDNDLPSSFYFDGELFPKKGSNMTFQELTGLVRRVTLKPGDIDRLKEVDYYIFDCFDLNDLELTTEQRLDFLTTIFQKSYSNIYLVPTQLVQTKEDIKEAFKTYIEEGYEGLMLRTIDGPYQIDKRSKHLLKYKEFVEDEYEIIGYHEGTAGDSDTIIWELKTKDGKEFSARPKGTRAYRRQLFKDGDKYIGKKVTVIYQELTDDGIPRFPVAKDVREGY